MLISVSWLYLFSAGIFEIIWVISMKYSDGFTKFIPSLITILAMIFSFYTLSKSIKDLPLGTAYAVWTGIGAFGAAIYGMFFFGESKDLLRIISLMMIILGVLGLKITCK